jgi:multidrug efflux pump subunit AcrA (membrane-fusion protein)
MEELAAVKVKLGEAQAELAKAQARTETAQAELAEAQSRTEATLAETDERLKSLINVVERFISERRNGES